jgi:endonuclease/exonuclease/phosphatase family metal-dependent hydrolase
VRWLQLQYLRARLPRYAFLARGRVNGGRRGEACPVLYRRDRFDAESWEVRWFGAGHRGRIATLAELRERDSGAGLGVVSTHFDYRSAAVRLNSAVALVEWLRERDVPWIVMGDLNATSADASVATLLGAGLRDALDHLAPQGPGVATGNRFTGRVDGRRIDHILVSEGWDVVEAGIVRTAPGERLASDHWPVRAVLRRGSVWEPGAGGRQGVATANVSQEEIDDAR